jgi:hypothetical protein
MDLRGQAIAVEGAAACGQLRLYSGMAKSVGITNISSSEPVMFLAYVQ